MSVRLLVVGFAIVIFLIVLGVALMLWSRFRRKARSFGYPSLSAYLDAVPGSDEEKRDAVSLSLTGLIMCLLGLVFPPFLLIGLFPLFYGTRKVAWASMGLGLVDDADQTGT